MIDVRFHSPVSWSDGRESCQGRFSGVAFCSTQENLATWRSWMIDVRFHSPVSWSDGRESCQGRFSGVVFKIPRRFES
jgi:hypothetical protein